MSEVNVWVETYRPDTIEKCILPKETKEFFKGIVESGTLSQSLLLCGGAGSGKTTVAKALCNELGLDYMFINASDESGIDILRNQIRRFASAKSLKTSKHGKPKVVILDEADYLNPNSTQPALRGFIEEFSTKGCHFILTCNYRNRVLEPIQSRCAVVDFSIPKVEKKPLLMQLMKSVIEILESEDVKYDKKVLAEVIMKYFPDIRRCLNEFQRYARSTNGNIDVGILSSVKDVEVDSLMDSLKNKKYEQVRKWVFTDNSDIDPTVFFGRLSGVLHANLKNASKPMADVMVADYQYKSAFVPDQQVNLMALLVEVMMQCEFE